MSERMRLGYLTNLYGRESDTFIRLEVRELRRLGHEVWTFSIRRPDPEECTSEDVRSEQARTEYVLEAGTARLALAFVLCALDRPARMARALACAWRTAAPGLRGAVWQLFYLLEAAHLARRIQALGIEHVHDHLPMNSANVCMLAAVLADVTWSMTVHGANNFEEPARWALAEKLARAAFTVFVGDFGRSLAMLHAPPSAWPKLHVVRCGLDPAFRAQPARPLPRAPRLVFVGRLSPEKGGVLLIEAAAQLRSEGVPVELTLIGDGPARAEIEELVARHGLAGSVRLLGACGSERVREEILASRALVLPSFTEGLPIALLEAFALGRPIVSTWVAGIPELVRPGESGFLVAPGSLAELTDAMRTVVTAPVEKLEEMGRRGAARVAAQHDSEESARRLEALLRAALEPRRHAERAAG